MNPSSFSCWLTHREHAEDHHVPEADRLGFLISQAGAAGVTRKQIGDAIDLDRDVLNELLAGFVASGLLRVTSQNGVPVYRAASVAL
jgi:hypothetical protein